MFGKNAEILITKTCSICMRKQSKCGCRHTLKIWEET